MPLLPFDDRPGNIWYNGALVPWANVRLHAFSHSLHFSSSVFEGIRVYNSDPFKLNEHTKRLFRSAQILDFEIPFTEATINEACHTVIREQSIVDGYIRPIAWRGPENMAPGAMNASIHLAIAAWDWPVYYSNDAKTKGIRLKIADWKRPAPDTAPVHAKASGLYQICTLAKHDAERAGYEDALMLDYRGFIAETTSSNIFFVIDDVIFTPIADCFLDGITRQTIIDLATNNGMKVVESHMQPEQMEHASEAFITGTAAEVTAIREIANFKFKPGKITQTLQNLFEAETML